MIRYRERLFAIGLMAMVLLALYGCGSEQEQATNLVINPTVTASVPHVATGTPTASTPKTSAIDLLKWALDGLQGEKSYPATTPTPMALPTLDPKASAEQHYRLGYTFYTQDYNFDEAIRELDLALKLNPYHVNAIFLRGHAYTITGQADQALADYNRAIQMSPDYAEAYVSRGYVYRWYKDDYDRAIADYKKAIALAPTYGLAYSELGYTYYELEDYDRAIITLDKAIQVSPLFAVAYNNRGMTYSDMDKSEKAIKDFTRAIELNPKYWQAYSNRAWEYEYMDNTAAAISDFKMVIRLSNDPRAVQRAREEILALQGA